MMTVYELFIRGENFRWKEEDAVKLMGFHTTRWIEASDKIAAEDAVVEVLRKEPALQKPEWHNGADPKAKVYIEEITEVISGGDG